MDSNNTWDVNANDDGQQARVTQAPEREFYSDVTSSSSTQAQQEGASTTNAYSQKNEPQDSFNARTERVEHQRDSDTQSLGELSDDWKTAASCLALSTVVFMITVLVMFAFSLTIHVVLLYIIAALTLLYGAFRFGFSYYIYKDAKKIAYHSRNTKSVSFGDGERWEPNPVLWAVLTFAMPPFIEYGPGIVYFMRRHQRTGVP